MKQMTYRNFQVCEALSTKHQKYGQFVEFWQPFLIQPPTVSELKAEGMPPEIEYDRFTLAKWLDL